MKKLVIGIAAVLLLAGTVVFAQQNSNKTTKKENCEMTKKDNCPNRPGCICTPEMGKKCATSKKDNCPPCSKCM